MITRIRNGRNEWASYDTDARRFWSGTNADENSIALGEFVSVQKLISQFYAVSPWSGEYFDAKFDNAVRSIAASCFAGQKPSVAPKDADERAAFSALWRYADRIRTNNEILASDSVLFAEAVSAAGAADLVFKCNGRTYLCGWKTGNMMLPAKGKFSAPFSHLVADPITIYSLQCAMLQVLAEVGGYFPSAVFAPSRLLWLHKEDGAWKVDALTCRDLRNEASMMLMCRPYTRWFAEWKERCTF